MWMNTLIALLNTNKETFYDNTIRQTFIVNNALSSIRYRSSFFGKRSISIQYPFFVVLQHLRCMYQFLISCEYRISLLVSSISVDFTVLLTNFIKKRTWCYYQRAGLNMKRSRISMRITLCKDSTVDVVINFKRVIKTSDTH